MGYYQKKSVSKSFMDIILMLRYAFAQLCRDILIMFQNPRWILLFCYYGFLNVLQLNLISFKILNGYYFDAIDNDGNEILGDQLFQNPLWILF